MATVVCMSGVVLLENPGSSIIYLHDRFQWFLQQLEQAGMVAPSLDLESRHLEVYDPGEATKCFR